VKKDDRTLGERVADDVATFAGSWRFILIFTFLLFCWITFNSVEYLSAYHFDPYPFILLNLILSFIAAFQAPFIMMSQNRTEHKQDEAYRDIFFELKELLHQDIEHEREIQSLEHQIKEDVNKLMSTQNRLLEALYLAIKLGQLTKESEDE
jgi:uncharacterized membrane protein